MINMNVAIIYPLDSTYDGKGGAVRYINNLIKTLIYEGVNTTLIGVQITEQKFAHQKFNYIPILKNSNIWWKYLIALFFKLPSLNLPKDMVINVHRIEYILPFIVFYRNNPLVYTIHGERLGTAKANSSPSMYKLIDKVYFLYEILAFRRVNKVIAVSDKVRKSFVKYHPSIDNKVVVVPVGVNLKKFDTEVDALKIKNKYMVGKEDFVILFVGVLGKVKNIPFLIDCFRSVSLKKNAKLIIVGDGDEKASLINKVNELQLQTKVFFTGEINHEKISDLYAISDMFVLTSFSEGSPNVLKEALASGIPIVSTDVGDARDLIVNKYLGKVVTDYNVSDFSNAMLEVINLVEKDKDKISSKCKNHARKYDLGSVTKEIMGVYRSCF